MSVVQSQNTNLPRPVGRALIVGSPSCRVQPMSVLQRLGFNCAELDDPYAAIVELMRRPMVYRALVLSLASVYREELQIIATVKRKLRHVDIWLTQADGRLNSMAEAMRYGADGLLTDDGLHPATSHATSEATVDGPPTPAPMTGTSSTASLVESGTFSPTPIRDPSDPFEDSESQLGEPVLTADELRALLQEQPSPMPFSAEGQ